MAACVVEDEHAVGIALTAVELGYPRPREDGDLRRPAGANSFECRDGHHCIAHPVRGAHQNLHGTAPCRLRSIVSFTVSQNFSPSGRRSAIRQYKTRSGWNCASVKL